MKLKEMKSTLKRKLSGVGTTIMSGGGSVNSLTTENMSIVNRQDEAESGVNDAGSHHSKSSYGESAFGEPVSLDHDPSGRGGPLGGLGPSGGLERGRLAWLVRLDHAGDGPLELSSEN